MFCHISLQSTFSFKLSHVFIIAFRIHSCYSFFKLLLMYFDDFSCQNFSFSSFCGKIPQAYCGSNLPESPLLLNLYPLFFFFFKWERYILIPLCYYSAASLALYNLMRMLSEIWLVIIFVIYLCIYFSCLQIFLTIGQQHPFLWLVLSRK